MTMTTPATPTGPEASRRPPLHWAWIVAATAFVTDTAGDSLSSVAITGSRTAVTVTITVRGSSLSLVPGWTPTVERSASLPVERITR